MSLKTLSLLFEAKKLICMVNYDGGEKKTREGNAILLPDKSQNSQLEHKGFVK